MKTSDLAYELRCATKRTDLPDEIVRLLSEAYEAIERLRAERDEARRKFCQMMSDNSRLDFTTPQWFAEEEDWDCYKEDGK